MNTSIAVIAAVAFVADVVVIAVAYALLRRKVEGERAGIPYRDEDGLFADFHANRHTFISNLSRAGVPLVFVDPAYTSQTCAECGHVDKRNRVDQGLFICRGCGVVGS